MKNVYPAARYELWIFSAYGERLDILETFSELSFSRAFGSVGRFSITLPFEKEKMPLYRADNIIHIMRTPRVGTSTLEFGGLIRTVRYKDNNGVDNVILGGTDGLDILKSRIIAARSGDALSEYIGDAASAIYTFCQRSMSSIVLDAERRLDTYGFRIEGTNVTFGAQVDVKFPWRNLLDVCKAISDLSVQKADPVYFDVIPVAKGDTATWRMYVNADYLNTDRSYASESQDAVVFSKEFGNLENPDLFYDFSDEYTYVYVGGEGEASARELASTSDSERVYLSPWNRRERFISFSTQETANALTDRAQQALREGKPKVIFRAVLKDSLQTRYGLDWRYGDRIAVNYLDKSFTGLVNALSVRLDRDKKETIEARVEIAA